MRNIEQIVETSSLNSVDSTQALSFTKTEKVSIRVRNFSIKLRQASFLKNILSKRGKRQDDVENQNVKTILNPVSFDIKPGTVTAIMGGSGSGKTTLLNSMSGRFANSSNLIKEGTVEFNGKENISTIRNAYVIQQDILLPQLTCYESLSYAAELRLPKLTDKTERQKLVNQVISELGLKECRDTIVGDSSHKGLSGGEKRRLSIGIQMLTNPSVLFLDEPTTGLDAYSAHLLVLTLKNLAKTGKSFVMSIHQPRSDIFFLFDNIVLLSNGSICYGYTGAQMLPYFNSLGYFVPKNVNPADYVIDITSIDKRAPEAELETSRNLLRLIEEWEIYKDSILLDDETVNKEIDENKSFTTEVTNNVLENTDRAPFIRQVKILTRRTFLLSFRDKYTMMALLFEPILMGLVSGWVFFNPGNSYVGIRTKQGIMYTSNGLQGYVFILYEIYRLSLVDIRVFDMERLENCVTASAFIVSRRIAKFLIEDLPIPFLFSLIVYFMAGLRTDSASHFFIFFAGCLLNHLCTIAFGTFCIALSREFAIASLYGNLYYTFLSMASGFFVNSNTMPVYVKWSKYLSSIWYGFGMFCSNEFTGFYGDCYTQNAGNPNVDSLCQLENGLSILDTLGYPQNWIKVPMCVELGIFVLFTAFAMVVLHYNVVDVSLAKEIKSNNLSTNDENLLREINMKQTQSAEADEFRIDVHLRDVELDVSLHDYFNVVRHGKVNVTTKKILSNVNADFHHGKLNAIMGPSGSGKSSLLNFISGRISSTLTTTYQSSGNVIFDRYKIHSDMVRSLCSYVSQDDNNLLPSLTVKETLQFAAKLRLSKTMSLELINRTVDEIISKMGLRDCQNTPIGSDLKKGISGGEKRRVSISIQLLNNPKILLLDEPTSGLDSFTASSILAVLKKLSDEGKTIIMTIHQPRSDLFNQFGSVLLLLKGGRVLFDGTPKDMVQHFTTLGYPVPELTNVADHVLDLISVNIQSIQKEGVSRVRVQMLLEAWEKKRLNLKEASFESEVVELDAKGTTHIFSSIKRERASFHTAYPLLCKRQLLGVLRDRDVVVNRISQVAGLGIILALFFAPLKHTYIGVTNRLMMIQQGITLLYFVGMLNNLCIYPQERNFFYEEYHDSVIGLEPFFLLYFTIEIPFEIFSSLIFSVFMVMVTGLPRTAGLFFAIMYISACIVNCGESIGIIFNSVFNHVGFAMNIISVILSVSTFMAGLMSLNMSGFLKAINWTSPLHYGVMAATNMSFRREDKFSCDATSMNPDGTCVFADGQDVLDQYNLNYNYHMLLGVLILLPVLYRFFLTYMVMKIKLLRFDVEKLIKNPF